MDGGQFTFFCPHLPPVPLQTRQVLPPGVGRAPSVDEVRVVPYFCRYLYLKPADGGSRLRSRVEKETLNLYHYGQRGRSDSVTP